MPVLPPDLPDHLPSRRFMLFVENGIVANNGLACTFGRTVGAPGAERICCFACLPE